MRTHKVEGRHALRSNRRGRRPLLAAGALTVAGATILGTGVVNAAINAPGAPGVIHACVADAGGAVRIIKGDTCNDNERFVKWHKSGPRGLRGLQGLTGATGPVGPKATNHYGWAAVNPVPVLFDWGTMTGTANNTWADLPNLVMTAPVTGTYLFNTDIFGDILMGTGGIRDCDVAARLYRDNLTGPDGNVGFSERMVVQVQQTYAAGSDVAGNGSMSQQVALNAGDKVKVQIKWLANVANGCGSAAGDKVQIIGDQSRGQTVMNWVLLEDTTPPAP